MKIHHLIHPVLLTIFFWQQVNGQSDTILVPMKDSVLNKFGYVNKKDSSIFFINPKFDHASEFHHGYARVSIDGLYGLINKRGGFVFKPRSGALSTVYHEILIAGDSVFTILNLYGEPIVNFDYTSFNWKGIILFELPFQWEKEILNNLNDSTLKDGELMARVLSMYQVPKIRFIEMVHIAMINDDFAILVLDCLHGFLEQLYGKNKLRYMKSKHFKRNEK